MSIKLCDCCANDKVTYVRFYEDGEFLFCTKCWANYGAKGDIKIIPTHIVDRVKAESLEKIMNYMNKKKVTGSQHQEN